MTVYTWDKTASNNDDADSTINWREGQAPSTVNNSARGMMAAVAKLRDDISGNLVTGGSSTAYTLTTNQVFSALTDGLFVRCRMSATNGATPTLNVDSLGAKAIASVYGTAVPTGSLLSGGVYDFVYDSTDDKWIVVGIVSAAALGLGTGDSPLFTGVSVGNADTTITRSAAGQIAVEGVAVPTISTTDTLTNKTLNLASNTLTGTTAQFNTALSDGDFATLAGTETLTNKTLTSPAINTPTIIGGSIYGALILGTAAATTSGSAVEFTSLPSGIKRITFMFNGVSVTGTDELMVQLGDSGGYTTSGYVSACLEPSSSQDISTGFLLNSASASGNAWTGSATISSFGSNIWHIHGNSSNSSGARAFSGAVTLSGTLTRLRISPTGANTFDAGSVNIIYE